MDVSKNMFSEFFLKIYFEVIAKSFKIIEEMLILESLAIFFIPKYNLLHCIVKNIKQIAIIRTSKYISMKLVCCGHHKTFFYINVVH